VEFPGPLSSASTGKMASAPSRQALKKVVNTPII
jgi:hypothetical protein